MYLMPNFMLMLMIMYCADSTFKEPFNNVQQVLTANKTKLVIFSKEKWSSLNIPSVSTFLKYGSGLVSSYRNLGNLIDDTLSFVPNV